MASIEKRGYIPKSAVWVNAVTDNGTKQGNIIQYRLVAGRHRYEACRRIELNEIPSQLYYNLTDEEECELDTLDNDLDEHHKPINFLEVAESL
jgi:ParB-like chromosome segregation protein Spo0J